MTSEELEHLREESTRHMRAGIPLLESGCWEDARGHFARAAELRGRMPWRDDAESAWVLAAAWINLSDTLARQGNPELFPEAVAHLDRGIEAMGYVPLGENPAFPERLILAWINRATLCAELSDRVSAERDFRMAVDLFGRWGEAVTPQRVFLNAMLYTNRSRFRIATGEGEPAWLDAKQAVALLDALEPAPPVVAAGIKARSVLCRALALVLEDSGALERVGDWIAEATDAAEEALALVKSSGFREVWVADLVRYGAKIYRSCQPHFLGDFIGDWLGDGGPLAGDEGLRGEMKIELLLARAEVERKVLLAPHDTDFVRRQTRILKALQAGERVLEG